MKLETNRLYIRSLREDDWQDMKSIFLDFRNSQYAIYDMALPTEDETIKALVKGFAESELFFVVFLKEAGDMIGYMCFHKNQRIYDLGYCFHSAYHANGYAYESIKTVLKYYARKHGITHFTAETAIDNTPSCGLLKKLGFACTSTETVSFDNTFSFQGGNFELIIEGE